MFFVNTRVQRMSFCPLQAFKGSKVPWGTICMETTTCFVFFRFLATQKCTFFNVFVHNKAQRVIFMKKGQIWKFGWDLPPPHTRNQKLLPAERFSPKFFQTTFDVFITHFDQLLSSNFTSTVGF